MRQRQRQLQLFTSAELAKMRDRTASRNYSAERDEFRRDHERRRAFGLARRHAERLRRIQEASREPCAACSVENCQPASRPSPGPATVLRGAAGGASHPAPASALHPAPPSPPVPAARSAPAGRSDQASPVVRHDVGGSQPWRP